MRAAHTELLSTDTYWRRERTSRELKAEFLGQRHQVEDQFKKGKPQYLLDLVLRRLAVLRNQIVHGCVTYVNPILKSLR